MSERTADQIIAEATESFDLIDTLEHRPLVTDSITLYSDEPAGRELGGIEQLYKEVKGIRVPAGKRRWGALGEIDLLRETNKDGVNDEAISAQLTIAEAAKAKLEASALTFHFQGLPEFIMEEARASAQAAVGIEKMSEITPEQGEQFSDRLSAEIVSRIVTVIVDAKGRTAPVPSADAIPKARTRFPRTEWARLAAKISEVQYAASISEQAVGNADF
ncbi:hypothetical protein BKA24_001806 [Microbacterium marinum]|uniref:Uncharacterized protein n=1 Tax=Microbacterium marinum TaxID=421115 RepID=A0A7W7BQR6_9MICO|nr:hypothetical protein [Microbacterium marinum]MBB4667097.1 hypothetical protein [Microbacterium marinum]